MTAPEVALHAVFLLFWFFVGQLIGAVLIKWKDRK